MGASFRIRLSNSRLKRAARLRTSICTALIAATTLACTSLGSHVYCSSLWGNLKPGPYAIGFQTIFAQDLSRNSLANASGVINAGRQMQINVWYPARAASQTSVMRFEDYVHLLAQELDFDPLNAQRKQQAETKFVEQPTELGGNAAALKKALPLILDLDMRAMRNAPASEGSFPLIVFPDYRAPATNSIMCEYLASHGFVVAATSLKGTYEAELDVGLTGIETIAADIAFVIGISKTSQTFPEVDSERIALMGVGITASACLALLTRNAEIDALISLDGGIPTSFEDRLLKRTPYFDISAIRVPLLAIHAPHPNVDPSILDQYKYSTRHLIHFPQMSEFHFLNYGMLERFSREIIGKPPGDTKAGFEWASMYVLNFLKAYLNKDARGLAFLHSSPEVNAVPRGLLSVQTKTGLRAPPTLPELKAMIRKGGVQTMVSVYRQLKTADPQPFTQETIVALYNWLSYQRDPDWKARRALSVIRVDSYPDSARAHFTMAQVSVQLMERELARKHFSEALRLLETDADPLLDFQTRKRIEQAARQGLKNLES